MRVLTSMRVRRLHFVLLLALVFLLWNFVTFYSLTRNKLMPEQVVKERELVVKLEKLEREMGRQLDYNKRLLENLMQIKSGKQVSVQQDANNVDNSKKDSQGTNSKTQVVAKPKAVVPDEMAASPEVHITPGRKDGILPILMIACDRVTVKRSLAKLLQYRPSATKFPIIVSQDCNHAQTAEVIQEFVRSDNVTHIRNPDVSNINLPWPQKKFVGYYKIARHYKWALDQVFVTFNFSVAIIVEDDLDISPDFYEYFSATYPILKKDPELWCVSAWNDNGKDGMVSNEAELLYRTDFFPGLGWMIERKVWLELRPAWPDTFWDDWMRHPEQRKDRQCIRPEICRTSTFGKKGVSKGLFYEKHLKFIRLNSEFVPFTKMDLSYLERANYDEIFTRKVYSAPVLTAAEVKNGDRSAEAVVRVEYTNKDSFKKLAKLLGIMDDFKAGVPRAAYRGVVSFMLKGRRVFLAPPPSWAGYDTSWS